MADAMSQEPLPGDDGATTGHQSHRYLRLSLAIVVFALFIGVGVEAAGDGWSLLPSISHYFYTPAHNVFVASLVAASLALVALAGRDLETLILDIAAVFAPLIALIPTGIDTNTLERITGRPATPVSSPCDPDGNCIPAEFVGPISNGVATYLLVLVVVVILTLALRVKTVVALITGWTELAVRRRVWTLFAVFTAPLSALVVAAWLRQVSVVEGSFPFNGLFGLSVHFTVTILFFTCFTVVPVINAVKYFVSRRRGEQPNDGEAEIKKRHLVVYIAVPAAMIIDIGWLIWIVHSDAEGSWVLLGEVVALALFAVFWVVQTLQRWGDPNQSSLAFDGMARTP
jgi:hypothetical protein